MSWQCPSYSQGNVVPQVTSLLGGGTVSPPEDQKLLNKYKPIVPFREDYGKERVIIENH